MRVGRHLKKPGDDENRQRQIAYRPKTFSQPPQYMMNRRRPGQDALKLWNDQQRNHHHPANPDDSRQYMKKQADGQNRLRHKMTKLLDQYTQAHYNLITTLAE